MRTHNPKIFGFILAMALATTFGLLSACGAGGETKASGIPLPDSAFRVEWGELKSPTEMKPGETTKISVAVTNTSDQTWPDPKTADPAATGAYAVRLGWRWRLTPDQRAGEGTSNSRTDLQKPLAPGESTTFEFDVTAPAAPGEYTLQVDLVQELVGWFEARGAATKTATITVR
jgi:hypothetical protein